LQPKLSKMPYLVGVVLLVILTVTVIYEYNTCEELGCLVPMILAGAGYPILLLYFALVLVYQKFGRKVFTVVLILLFAAVSVWRIAAN
jgi:hypothetical protein